ncbi:hypothetical protein ACFGVS_07765 [Mucilaginibacter sp. AW1-7]|jgi:hypothetical protein|uniref:hypothetical protein n=1 Tax=Mucilaginibacter sp. AW1-7 TaxID=3349874 RepID=UPI003F7314D5
MKDELTGTLVLVHPDLAVDPANKQNQIGIITDYDLGKDDVYVSFGRGEQALYSSDALLVMKSENDVYSALMENRPNLQASDFKTLFQANLMQQYGHSGQLKGAMELLQQNPVLRELGMISLEEKLGIVKTESVDLSQFRPPQMER